MALFAELMRKQREEQELDKYDSEPSDGNWISTAQALYQEDGRIEIDDNAEISNEPGDRDEGAYVQAWVWVERSEVDD